MLCSNFIFFIQFLLIYILLYFCQNLLFIQFLILTLHYILYLILCSALIDIFLYYFFQVPIFIYFVVYFTIIISFFTPLSGLKQRWGDRFLNFLFFYVYILCYKNKRFNVRAALARYLNHDHDNCAHITLTFFIASVQSRHTFLTKKSVN